MYGDRFGNRFDKLGVFLKGILLTESFRKFRDVSLGAVSALRDGSFVSGRLWLSV